MDTVEQSARDHDRYIELCALSTSGTLSASESAELEAHLSECAECREAYRQFRVLTQDGIPMLATNSLAADCQGSWDDSQVKNRLFSQIEAVGDKPSRRKISATSLAFWWKPAAAFAMAACLCLTVGVGAYQFGKKNSVPVVRTIASSVNSGNAERLQALTAEKQTLSEQLTADTTELTKLQAESKTKQAEVDKLQTSVHALQTQLDQLSASDVGKTEQVKALASERDSLAQQLQSAQGAYKTVQDELDSLKAQRNQNLLRTASLELEVKDLSARLEEQDRQLRDRNQYLASDRDIRELMGARELYIADVFDVAETGKTQQPFGRVFYTKNKSLIFYAFDLDRQPHVQDASIFQAWGRRGLSDKRPLNMGVFYLDNEANKRWVLRFEDPRALAQIDAVFVTVEPRLGIQKPSGKQLLFASLRTTPNHP